MHIEILHPVFRCQNDEDAFLSRLRELPGFCRVTRNGLNLSLIFVEGTGQEVLLAVDKICANWNTSFRTVDPPL